MKIFVIGSGAREHAIIKRLTEDENTAVYCSPGNPGIWNIAKKTEVNPSNFEEIDIFCKENQIDFVFVGPEQPLAEGIANYLIERNIPVFGPKKEAAEIETSKVFAKNLMKKYRIPSAQYQVFSKNELNNAIDYLEKSNFPIVLKADGLAAGKGVVICDSFEFAKAELINIFGGTFGTAGDNIVIEEFLEGEEASIFALTDGKDYVLLPSAQDHKRALDGDLGKNTGGMGAYSPAPIINEKLLIEIENTIIKPTLKAMENEDRTFSGCLYAGLMITKDGPKVIEFNCRFGDPETEVILHLVEGNFANLTYSIAKGKIEKNWITLSQNKYSSCVVLASKGYPESFEKGFEIFGLENDLKDDIQVFHAGTKIDGNKLVTNGGRVLCVSSTAATLRESLEKNYKKINEISFQGMFFRKDIGQKAFKHLKK
jgi:phosphoribosylamine--glycine ligase